MPAVAYELARPTPPALGTVVQTVLGPGTIKQVFFHIAGGGWMVWVKLPREVRTRHDFYTADLDVVLPEDGGQTV